MRKYWEERQREGGPISKQGWLCDKCSHEAEEDLTILPPAAITTGIEEIVCRDIAERQQKGIAKYGVTVANNPLSLREWLEHAYQESLDQAIYLRRSIAEIDQQPNP